MRVLCFIGVLSGVSAGVCGQGRLLVSDQLAQAEAYARTGAAQFGAFDTINGLDGRNFMETTDQVAFVGNFSGRGYARHGATFSPADPLIGGFFDSVVLDACTSAEIWSAETNNSEDRAYGLARGIIEFELTDLHFWDWTGGWQGGSVVGGGAYHQVTGHMSLTDLGSGATIVWEDRQSINGSGDWFELFSLNGMLGAGTYRLEWSHESVAANGVTPWGFYGVTTGGAPLTSCINSTFSVRRVPGPGALAVLGVGLLGVRRRR